MNGWPDFLATMKISFWPFFFLCPLLYGLSTLILMLKKRNKEFTEFLLIYLAITTICTIAAAHFLSKTHRQSFWLGEACMGVSLLTLYFSVYLFFLKKNIALLISVIVFKWPILVYVVYKMTKQIEIAPIFLSLGFVPVLISALVWSFLQKE